MIHKLDCEKLPLACVIHMLDCDKLPSTCGVHKLDCEKLPLAWVVHKLDCDKDFDDVAAAVFAGSFAHIGRTKEMIENLHLLIKVSHLRIV